MSHANLHDSAPTQFQDTGDVRLAYRRFGRYGWVTRTMADAELDGFVEGMASRLASFDKAALAAAETQINRATLPPDADLLAGYGEYAQSLGWPGFQARLPQFGKRIAQFGIDDVERRLGYYIGAGNQQH